MDLNKNIKRRKLNIWTVTGLIVIMIFFVLSILIIYVGEHFIIDEKNQHEMKTYLTYANEGLEDNFRSLKQISYSLINDIEYHKSNDNNYRFHGYISKIKGIKPDIVFIINNEGKIIWSKNNPSLKTGNYKTLSVIKKGLSGIESAGYELIPESLLKAEGLSEKSKVKIIKDENNYSNNTNTIKDGLTQFVSMPVRYNKNDKLVGTLVVGSLLNNNIKILEDSKKVIDGNISIIYDSVRISTTGKTIAGQTAVGTLMEVKVYEETILKGNYYYGETSTLGGKFIAAYKPLKDFNNKVIGAVAISVNQEPIIAANKTFQRILFSLVFLIFILIISLIIWIYKSIAKGIWSIVRGTKEIMKGNYSVRVLSPDIEEKWKLIYCQKSQSSTTKEKHTCKLPYSCSNVTYEVLKKACPACSIDKVNFSNDVYYLAKIFNYMAVCLEEREEKLTKANIKLAEKNNILIEQQEELQAQQEELEAQQSELIIANQQLSATIEDLDHAENIIYSLALAIEAKDQYTKGHSERVAQLAKELANHIGLSNEEQKNIEKAGILHDIGKIGIDDAVLFKPGRLTEDEFSQIKEHPIIGVNICRVLKSTKEYLPIIKHHHERYDGKGYPSGLIGKDIPLYARILAIADAYDAMTTNRPYRSGMTSEKAIKILQEESGKMWDPYLVKAFIELNELKENPSTSLDG